LITELVIPGMDGMALIRRVRDTCDAIRTIIITAYGSSESMAEAETLGVSHYLAKPFDLSELKSRVDELLASGGPCPSSWVGSVVSLSRIGRRCAKAMVAGGRAA
jgi:DNA-binding response OmpR family regulator